jgi:hypothetical protein
MKDVQVKKKKQLHNESTLPFIFAEPKRVWKPVVWKKDASHMAKRGERDDMKKEDKKATLIWFHIITWGRSMGTQ